MTSPSSPIKVIKELIYKKVSEDVLETVIDYMPSIDLKEGYSSQSKEGSLLEELVQSSISFPLIDKIAKKHIGEDLWDQHKKPWLLNLFLKQEHQAIERFKYGMDDLLFNKLIESTPVNILAENAGKIIGQRTYSWDHVELLLKKIDKKIHEISVNHEPAILYVFDYRAFNAFIQEGDPFQEIKGRPLWDELRERAMRQYSRQFPELIDSLNNWAKLFAESYEEKKVLKEYFEKIESYSGVDYLKKNKNWTEVKNEKGQSTMMVVCKRDANAMKAFMKVQKAWKGAGETDHDGRSLWHVMCKNGKDNEEAYVDFLMEKVPFKKDKAGCGLLTSLYRGSSEWKDSHKELWAPSLLKKVARVLNKASDWWGADDELSLSFADWMVNDRYWGQVQKKVHQWECREISRNVQLVTVLLTELDVDSLKDLHPAVAGALLLNYAVSDSLLRQGTVTWNDPVVQALLSNEPYVKVTSEPMIDRLKACEKNSLIVGEILKMFQAHEDKLLLTKASSSMPLTSDKAMRL